MLAGRNAFSMAFKEAGPKILEPIYDVEVFVPSDKMGDVMSDLQGRRGMIMGMTSENGYEKLVAKVPLKEMSNYCTSLVPSPVVVPLSSCRLPATNWYRQTYRRN